MEEKNNNLNVIFDDENVFGKVEGIIKTFYMQIKYDIDNIEDLDEKTGIIKEKLNLIDELITDCNKNEIGYRDVIKVMYNPMGNYYYEVV